MSTIKLMSEKLANLIAAGEVIERPSSVIKELVENSIDAEATSIFIGVLDAGKKEIFVKDNGKGMDREDAKNCFLRHASSKIKNEFDLNHIRTLGFRGEAIPSIAAVSKVELITSTYNQVGTKVISVTNHPLEVYDAPIINGTSFKVSDLFYNTPARLKYLKSNQVELASIIETVEHLALSFPNIAFELSIDSKTYFKTNGRGNLLECISKIYGNDIVSSLYPVSFESVPFSFDGYIAKPEINYSKKYRIITFLNQRYIYNYKFTKAIIDSYLDYLPPNRYPFVILNFRIDSSLVDVNVHPSKKEVRISLEDDIVKEIKNQILLTLQVKKPLYDSSSDFKSQNDLKISDLKADSNEDEAFLDLSSLKDKKEEVKDEFSPFDRKEEYENQKLNFEPTFESSYSSSLNIEEASNKTFNEENKKITVPMNDFSADNYYDTIFNGITSYSLNEMHPIGQVLHTYIVCDSSDGFYLIDQHAANERINYEKTEALFRSIKKRAIPLIPITYEMTYKENLNFDQKHIDELDSLGIKVESFGDKTLKVVEIPVFLTDSDDEATIIDIISSVLNDEKSDPIKLLHLAIATIACKKSIKANKVMSLVEMEGLIRDLAKCKNPANCPHGRPTLIKLTQKDIEKIFRRSGF